jgi:hypothetical protein
MNSIKRKSKNLTFGEDYKLFKSLALIYDEGSQELTQNELDTSFHESIKPIATFVQFLCLMPVCGISSHTVNDLKFKWKSFRVIMTIIYISYGTLTAILYFCFIYEMGINAQNIGELSINCCEIVIFIIKYNHH